MASPGMSAEPAVTAGPSTSVATEQVSRTRPSRSLSRDEGNVRSLTAAAAQLDGEGIRQMVQGSIAERGVLMTWEQLVRPVWERLRTQSDNDGWSVGEELVLNRATIEALRTFRPRRTAFPAPALLACVNEEHHTLSLEVLAAALTESGANCCVLGARVPARALADAVGRLKPRVVVIWSQTSDTADAGEISTVMTAGLTTTVVAAGPGWDAAAIPPLVTQPNDVGTATILTLTLLASP